ncbi:phosphoglycolate phosphatase [Muribaculaceae bacterium]|nr:phosphoglycolate phosphatase [Muribaculaceae bacterium]
MLEKLKMQGKVLAVASSKPQVFVEQILHHFEIYDYFSIVIPA